MSDSYETTSPSGSDVESPDTSGKVDAAKQEAADLKDTASSQAKSVIGIAKEEASTVASETKTQVKDLYAQTQRELKEQAGTQQQRIAAGLRSVGDELGSMADNTDGGGVARDLVQQVSGRLSSAATWLSDRDPSSVVDEVKKFARRKPGTFILVAAVAGIIAGRLTRALAANASDDTAEGTTPAVPPVGAPALIEPDPWATTPVGTASDVDAGAPLYAQTASSRPDILGEDGDDRPDAV